MEYLHGGDIYRNHVELDFSTNINPLGMPQEVMEAAKKGIEMSGSYPDAESMNLCQAISQTEEMDPGYILTGNGAAELIYAFAYGVKPMNSLLLAPSFYEYESSLKGAHSCLEYVLLEETNNFKVNDAIMEVIRPGIQVLYLCNPNNPTGNLIEYEKMKDILYCCKKNGVFLIIDECFMDFTDDRKAYSMKKFIPNFKNLLIIKSFTKMYAMPGLRLGYVMSSNKKILLAMKQAIQPWNTSIPAQLAGIAALSQKEYVQKTKQMIEKEKQYLLQAMESGLAEKIYGSSANFIFFRSSQDLYDRLLSRGILIRDCSNFGLEKGFYRICIKNHRQNMKLIETWKEI